MLSRIKIRNPDIEDDLANEFIRTAKDRILLRVGVKQQNLPTELESICVEVVTAMYNRYQMNHEGVDTERVDVFSVKFVNDLLKQYDDEFEEYKQILADEEDANRGKLRFL